MRGAARSSGGLGAWTFNLADAREAGGFCVVETQLREGLKAALLRDVFGNPFRPVRFDPAWRTADVLALARAAYEERLMPRGDLDLVRLGVLADALEECGCTSADVLGHLRAPGPHVRGCWVIESLLGHKPRGVSADCP